MRIIKEMTLWDFKPWAGAVEMYERLSHNETVILDSFFDEMSNCGTLTEVDVNEMLWFDDEYLITEILDADYEEFYNRNPLR